ncbi:RNA polymerase sigma factor [Neptunitalea chrysea]|uniref:RNA polymerase sigma factor n=1 Tax=Neptunitalea chrysea TaxID=1647581 RepID=A0A9W6B954_9FLAO|nr:RNA polymerase sigma factor [Neptunitalea chrysea]GLB54132.1 RNA polymerase sigma factor [Neptunitalea chrysea]
MENHFQILQLIAIGDSKAFEELYNLYKDKVYNTAISYAQSVADAEEITQDVFVKVYNVAAAFKGNSSVSTWIYRITVNTSLNYIKKRDRFSFLRVAKKDTSVSDFVHPGVLLENKEDSQHLFKAMELLPDTQKTAFILSFVEELPRKEVATIMETSLKAVESLLQRAKSNLREVLEKQYPERRNFKK